MKYSTDFLASVAQHITIVTRKIIKWFAKTLSNLPLVQEKCLGTTALDEQRRLSVKLKLSHWKGEIESLQNTLWFINWDYLMMLFQPYRLYSFGWDGKIIVNDE
jgi:hypothetical protein